MSRLTAFRASSTEQRLTAAVRGFLNGIWTTSDLKVFRETPIPIGVCVSGGPDSMALAYLLRQVAESPDSIGIRPLAFIVNHNARKGSTEEARYVGSQLAKLGIESSILEMHWPATINPTSLPDFELQARRARYRLIADLAIRRRIRHLFLGHHQDDQIETILMRLIRNSSDSFLGRQGIAKHGTVPCCEDMRGAQTAYNYERFETWLRRTSGGHMAPNAEIDDLKDVEDGKMVVPSEKGGLQIHRPLLDFPKADIIRFCENNNIPYVHDKTNFDPTLTLRNAVRYLRANHVLPRALRGPSILELQKQSQQWAKSLAARADLILQEIEVETCDLRSGRLTARLSSAFNSRCEVDPEAGAYALARLTGMVSPQSKDDEPTLVSRDNLADFLWRNKTGLSEQMTMQQVVLEKIQSCQGGSSSNLLRHDVTADDGGAPPNSNFDHSQATVWTLSRPPMRAQELKRASMAFSLCLRKTVENGQEIEDSKHELLSDEDRNTTVWSQWLLWDRRYWFRVRTKDALTMSTIRIRPYSDSDVPFVRSRLKDKGLGLQKILAEAAPGKSRYTIPVLVVDSQVSVFPTLNVVVPQSQDSDVPSQTIRDPILDWEVCYKALDQPLIKNHARTIVWKNARKATECEGQKRV